MTGETFLPFTIRKQPMRHSGKKTQFSQHIFSIRFFFLFFSILNKFPPRFSLPKPRDILNRPIWIRPHRHHATTMHHHKMIFSILISNNLCSNDKISSGSYSWCICFGEKFHCIPGVSTRVCVCACICDDVIGDGDYSHIFNLNFIFSKISQNENCWCWWWPCELTNKFPISSSLSHSRRKETGKNISRTHMLVFENKCN